MFVMVNIAFSLCFGYDIIYYVVRLSKGIEGHMDIGGNMKVI